VLPHVTPADQSPALQTRVKTSRVRTIAQWREYLKPVAWHLAPPFFSLRTRCQWCSLIFRCSAGFAREPCGSFRDEKPQLVSRRAALQARGPVAQAVEHCPFKARVLGSSPSRLTNGIAEFPQADPPASSTPGSCDDAFVLEIEDDPVIHSMTLSERPTKPKEANAERTNQSPGLPRKVRADD
jgi:hypothetical protein